MLKKSSSNNIYIYSALIGLLPILYFWIQGILYSGADMQFHINRIYEIYESISAGKIGLVLGINTSNQVGSIVNMFYPYLTLLPIVVIKLIGFNWIDTYYLSFWFYSELTFLLGYYSFKNISKNNVIAFWGSTFYTISSYRLYSMLGGSTFGEFCAITFLPLVFWGYINIIEKQEWIILSLSMVLIAYSHILTLCLVVNLLLLVTVVRWIFSKSQIRKEFASFIKASVVSMFAWSFFLLPFLYLNVSNNISKPYSVLHWNWAKSFLGCFFSLGLSRAVGIGIVLGIICYFFKWHQIKKEEKILFVLGIILVFISSRTFPWRLFENTIISVIQFPYRILPLAIVFLSYSAGLGVYELTKSRQKHNKNIYFGAISIIVILMVILGNVVLKEKHFSRYQFPEKSDEKAYMYKPLNYKPFASYKVNKNNFEAQYEAKFVTYGAFDYWTEKAVKNANFFINHELGTESLKTYIKEDYSIKETKYFKIISYGKESVELPFIFYKGVNYDIKVNGKKVRYFDGKNGGITVPINYGNNIVEINTNNNAVIYIGLILTVLTAMFYIYKFWKRNFVDDKET